MTKTIVEKERRLGEAFFIIRVSNTFVQCFLLLNKQGRAVIGIFEPGFDETLVSTREVDIAEHTNVFGTIE